MNEPMFTLGSEDRPIARRFFAELPAPPAARATMPGDSGAGQPAPLITVLSAG